MEATLIGALIIGGHVQGLGLVRALGVMGVPICLLDINNLNISKYSKYCNKFINLPTNFFNSSDEFCYSLKKINEVYNLQDWIIFPTDDLAVSYISQNKRELSEYFTIWTPDWECIKYCYNKNLSYRMAEKIGLPIPQSYFPEDISDLNEVNYLFKYPLIIKPSVMHEFYKITKQKVFIVNDKEELKREYLKACAIIKPTDVIIQEIIPGSADSQYSFGSFFKNTQALAYIQCRRSRQIPMDFGKASTFVEIVDAPELHTMGSKFLSAINYYGLSEVEFKKDSRDGKFKILDINPRTWKWHSLALEYGINLPYHLYCDLTEKEINVGETSKQGLKWVDFYSDFYVVINELLKGKMDIHDYLQSLKGKKTESVFSFDDLVPFIMETLLLPYLWKKR